MKNPLCYLFLSSMIVALTGCPTVEVIRYEVTDVAVEPPLKTARTKTKDGAREKLELAVSSSDGTIQASNPSASLAINGKRFFVSFDVTVGGKENLRISASDCAVHDKNNSIARIGSIHIQRRIDPQSYHEEYRMGKNWPDSIELKPGKYAVGFSANYDTPNFSSNFVAHIVMMHSAEPRSIDWKFTVTEQAWRKHKRRYLQQTATARRWPTTPRTS
jgi:hypothetical protein